MNDELKSIKNALVSKLMSNNCHLDENSTAILVDVVLDYISNEAKDSREVLNKILSTLVYFDQNIDAAGCFCIGIIISDTLKFCNEILLNKKFYDNGTIAHEFGHFISAKVEYNGKFIIIKCGVGITKYRYNGNDFILESDEHKGLNEAINSLRTNDRLLRMKMEGYAGYKIARELLSRIRTHYNISKEIITAETTHNAGLIAKAIKSNSTNSEKVSILHEDEILKYLDESFDFIVKEYLKRDDDSLSKILSTANDVVKFLELGGAPIEAKELDKVIDSDNRIEIVCENDLGLGL